MRGPRCAAGDAQGGEGQATIVGHPAACRRAAERVGTTYVGSAPPPLSEKLEVVAARWP